MLDIALIILGLLFLIAAMVLFLNPPEAWVKRAFRGPQPSPRIKPPDKNSASR